MRGVEDGFALVRAANEGLVSASDAEGRLVAMKTDAPTGLTMIVADLPLGPGPTLYVRIGDVFAWLCAALVLLIGAYTLYTAKRPKAGAA
jgi:apolipoprotein N-acyltransferase